MQYFFSQELIKSLNWNDLKKIFQKIPTSIKQDNIEEILNTLKNPKMSHSWTNNPAGSYLKNHHFLNIEYSFSNSISAKIAYYFLKQVIEEKNRKKESNITLNVKYNEKEKKVIVYHLSGMILSNESDRIEKQHKKDHLFQDIIKEVNLLMSTTLIQTGVITLHNNLYLKQGDKKDLLQVENNFYTPDTIKKMMILSFSAQGNSFYSRSIFESIKTLNSKENLDILTHSSSNLLQKSLNYFRKDFKHFQQYSNYLSGTQNFDRLDSISNKKKSKIIK